MKKVAGTLKIDQAQYRELEAFSKFSSDMDPITLMALDKGRKNNRLLIQSQYAPMPVGEQVAVLYCGTKGLLRDIRLEQVEDFQTAFLSKMRAFHQEDVLVPLSRGEVDAQIFDIIEQEASSIVNGLKI
jgi:F-type H+-transporting ATPase subunit alpha